MTNSCRPSRLFLLSFAAAMATAQRTGTASPAGPSPSSGSATSSEAATTTDMPLSLWGIANSLLTSYYPSTTLDGVATLSWPGTVVIDGTTYNAQSLSDAIATSAPTATQRSLASASATPTSPAANEDDNGLDKTKPFGDKKLGIILGCVIGFVTLALMGVVFWCLKRRKDDTGSFFMRRRTPSIASTASTRRSWLPGGRPDTYANTSYVTAGRAQPDEWQKQPQMAVRPQMGEPREPQHPAFAARQRDGSRSTSEDNPFYTPAERLDAQLGHGDDPERGAYDPHPVELDNDGRSRRGSSVSLRAGGDRPPTPFSPMEMMGFGAARPGPAQVDRRDFGEAPAQYQAPVVNPFSSPEDEQDDVISPILPSKSPERRHSPMVHYPSWSEVSEFDFRGDGRHGLRNASSSETDGGDGWRPARERQDGRYELA